MEIFESPDKKIKRRLRFLFPFALFILVPVIFYLGIGRTSAETLQKEQSTLEQALKNGAVHTYALTGSYPASLSELVENYQIQYDHNRFVIEYTPNGSNLFPYISVIALTETNGGGL
jgi:hypothetical protein